MTIGELVEQLGGKLAHGRPATEIAGVNGCERVTSTDLLFAEDTASVDAALRSPAAAVVLKVGLAASYASSPSIAVVEVDQPKLWFARAAKLLAKPLPAGGVHPSAVVGAEVKLGAEVTIAACAVIGDHAQIGAGSRIEAGAVIGAAVRIGEHCRIYPRVVVYPGTTIGNRVMIHAGVVLGADGFGYVRDPATGAYTQFPQQGTLVIEDDVEIGANTTIDRGALEETRIERGVKIDNLVHLGHNVHVGHDVVIAAQTGVSGSSSIGANAIVGGQVGIGDHAHVGERVILGSGSGILTHKKVKGPGVVFWGRPARPLRQYLKELAALAHLARSSKDEEKP